MQTHYNRLPSAFGPEIQPCRRLEIEKQRPRADSVLPAEVLGAVVGCLSFDNGSYRRIAHRGSLAVSVRENWRGQGIGTAMLQALLDWAEANPLIEKIGLSVFANNVDAIRLYERLGFVEEGRQPREMKLGPGEYVDNILMYRLTRPACIPAWEQAIK